MNPSRIDAIVTTNLFADILSDICAELVVGLGLAPGANIGDDQGIFEAVHGSVPVVAGKNIANPTARIQGSVRMLDDQGLNDQSERLRKAVQGVIGKSQVTTLYLGGFLRQQSLQRL